MTRPPDQRSIGQDVMSGNRGGAGDRADTEEELREELAFIRRQRDELAAENERLRRKLADRDAPTPERFDDDVDIHGAVGRTGGRLFALGAGDPTIDANSSDAAKLAEFRSRFRGRDDVYALRWEDQRTGKSGYAPAVEGGWGRAKRSGRRDYRPFTDDVVVRHLRGHETVGLFPLLQDDSCWLLACDFDGAGWLLDARAFHDTCVELGIPVAVERSRSGEGAHAWIFFSAPVSATSARRMGAGLLRETADRRGELDVATYDRLVPSQDLLPTGGMGNLIALPLQGTARRNGNGVFIDPSDGRPYQDQWRFLAGVGRLTSEQVDEFADSLVQPVAWQDLAEGRRPGGSRGARLAAPEVIVATRASGIHLETAGWPPWLMSEVKHLASLHNPEYYRRQKRRMSTHDTPRMIRCYEQDLTHLHVPRGLGEELEQLAAQEGITLQLLDRRPDPDYIDVAFCGELSNLQREAVNAVLGHDLATLVAPPGTGKTVMACAVIAARATPTLVLVHRKPLIDQWRRVLSDHLGLPVNQIGQIGGGRDRPTGLVDIAMLQSLTRRDDLTRLFSAYPHIVADECHHIPAQSFEQVVRAAPARYVVGLTATPYRRDGLEGQIAMQCGKVRHTIEVEEVLDDHGLTLDLRVHETAFELDAGERPIQQVFQAVVADTDRTAAICGDIEQALDEGGRCLVLTQRKDHLYELAERLGARDPIVLEGGLGALARRAATERLASVPTGQPCLVIATGQYVGEGFDCPPLDTLFLTFPMSFKGSIVQYVGRLLRPAPGKDEVTVHDYVDSNVPVLATMFNRRRSGYRKLGLR